MTTAGRVGLIVAGYVAAAALAAGVTAADVAATDTPERQASSGMAAFGDGLLFLAAFSLAAAVPTAGALFLLRGVPRFWGALRVLVPALAATGLAALLVYWADRAPDPGPLVSEWSAFAILRILLAPPLGFAFCLAGLFAPERSARAALFVSTLMEAATFGGGVLRLFASL